MTALEAVKIAVATLTSIGLGGGIVVALGSWLGKVWASRILEGDRAHYQTVMATAAQEAQRTLEQLKGELQKRVLVHRVQFEAEFSAYQQIWQALMPAILASLQLRPIVDHIDENVSEEERKQQRLQVYLSAFNNFLTAAQTHRPFLPPAVDAEVQNLVRFLLKEQVSFQYSDHHSADYWDKQQANTQQIKQQGDRICEAIRARIGILEVSSD